MRGDVCVFVGRTDTLASDPSRLTRALGHLSTAERDRYARFKHERDRWMFALGREMARTLVGDALGCPAGDWVWREGPHGRPEIAAPPTDVHFNLSHSAGVVVCAIARGRTIGVDIEDLNRRAPDPAIVARYCSPAETADVHARGDGWPARFLAYWTLKEAYLKARGLGIAVHLADISFALSADEQTARIGFERSLAGTDDHWAFHLARLDPHHLVATAVHNPDDARPAL